MHAQALPQPPLLQREIRTFVETGRLSAGSQAYQQAFVALRLTALGRRLGISDSATESRLYVTRDFSNTVVNHVDQVRDEYVRPVHWLIWSRTTETALICSSFEANAVLPLIRGNSRSPTHLITYATPVTRSMLVFDSLRFYSIPALPEAWRAPAWLVCDLGIFAGRLYFDFKLQSHLLYQALDLPSPQSLTKDRADVVAESELWHVLPYDETTEDNERQSFSPNPIQFLQEWLAIRRNGQDFSQTMMGELCRGRRLDEEQTSRIEPVESSENREPGSPESLEHETS